jgi:hypothetical protein
VWVALARRPGDPCSLLAFAASFSGARADAEADISAIAGDLPLGYILTRMPLREARALGSGLVFAASGPAGAAQLEETL